MRTWKRMPKRIRECLGDMGAGMVSEIGGECMGFTCSDKDQVVRFDVLCQGETGILCVSYDEIDARIVRMDAAMIKYAEKDKVLAEYYRRKNALGKRKREARERLRRIRSKKRERGEN